MMKKHVVWYGHAYGITRTPPEGMPEATMHFMPVAFREISPEHNEDSFRRACLESGVAEVFGGHTIEPKDLLALVLQNAERTKALIVFGRGILEQPDKRDWFMGYFNVNSFDIGVYDFTDEFGEDGVDKEEAK